MKRLAVLVLILALTLVSGCGRKTPPVPPAAVIAQTITDLRSQIDDQSVTLTWTMPRLSITDTRINTIRSFIVYKARIPVDRYCPTCPVVYHSHHEVDARGRKPGSSVSFRDTHLEPGYHYVYMVRSNSGWRILSNDSNRIDFVRHHALLPPAQVIIHIGDSNLRLTWPAVEQRADGSPVSDLRYQVYRSLDNEKFSPLGGSTSQLSYIDTAVINGRTYFYHIRAVHTEQGVATLGMASKTAIAIPVDMTPPVPPSNLEAFATKDGIQLHWLGSPDSDVAGYHIYRQESDGTWQKIASTSKGAIAYTDRSPLPAGPYHYRITAFDQGIRRNESAPSRTVTCNKPENS